MKSLIIIALFACLSSPLFAQDCNNPLLDFFGLQGLDSPQSGEDLPYCSGLQGGETCCSANTVGTFQNRVNAIIDRLNNYAAARDLYVAQLRNSYYERFQDVLDDINEHHLDEVRSIREDNATIADQLQGDIDSFNQNNVDAREINDQFVGALNDYQNARTKCFTTALQVQASSWCLACNPNYADLGVNDDGSVTFANGLCQTVNDACRPFFQQGARFNPLIKAREAYWRLLSVSKYLNDYSDSNELVDFVIPQDPYNPLPEQEAVEVPADWNQNNVGNDQCQFLWAGNDQLNDLLAVGAPAAEQDNNEEAVVEEEDINVDEQPDVNIDVDQPDVTIVDDTNSRLLQDALQGDAGVWAPNLNATGLDFDVRKDPADFFGASDYSDYFNQTQNASDATDGDTDDDNTDHDFLRNN